MNEDQFEKVLHWGYVFRIALVAAATLGGLWFAFHKIIVPAIELGRTMCP